MLSHSDQFYLNQEEPQKSCLIVLKEIILSYHPKMAATYKYGAPYFLYEEKRMCYLWIDKKTHEPYVGIIDGNKIEHPMLEQGNRKRMKIFRINPNEDIQVKKLYEIFDLASALLK